MYWIIYTHFLPHLQNYPWRIIQISTSGTIHTHTHTHLTHTHTHNHITITRVINLPHMTNLGATSKSQNFPEFTACERRLRCPSPSLVNRMAKLGTNPPVVFLKYKQISKYNLISNPPVVLLKYKQYVWKLISKYIHEELCYTTVTMVLSQWVLAHTICDEAHLLTTLNYHSFELINSVV